MLTTVRSSIIIVCAKNKGELDKIQTITLHRKEANGMYRVEMWDFPLDVLVKFKSLMFSQTDYFWRRFLVDHPVAARYRVANTDQPFFVSPKSIIASNPRFIYNQGTFDGFVELFPNTEIFLAEHDYKHVSNTLSRVKSFLLSNNYSPNHEVGPTASK